MNIQSIFLSTMLAVACVGLSACDESRGNDFKGDSGAAGLNGNNGNTGASICEVLISTPGNGVNNDKECEDYLKGKDGKVPTAAEICKAANPAFDEKAKDSDNDCINDAEDNCPFTANPNQKQDSNGRIGDACLGDFDNDGIANESDACPLVPGTVCTNDFDGDGVTDAEAPNGDNDNCPFHINPDQTVSKPEQPRLDGRAGPRGAACVNDWDGDGIADDVDNCPTKFNPSQRPEDSCTVVTPPVSAGLIDVVESLVSNLTDDTAIVPVRELVAALASANAQKPGALAALTGPLNDLSTIDSGPLGPLSALVQGLVATNNEALEPLISSLNLIIGGLQNDPTKTPEQIAGLLLGLPNLLAGLGSTLAGFGSGLGLPFP